MASEEDAADAPIGWIRASIHLVGGGAGNALQLGGVSGQQGHGQRRLRAQGPRPPPALGEPRHRPILSVGCKHGEAPQTHRKTTRVVGLHHEEPFRHRSERLGQVIASSPYVGFLQDNVRTGTRTADR